MPLVAIAGGTSVSLGRSLTLAILAAFPSGKWKPIILSRSSTPPPWATCLPSSSFEIRKVDYTCPSSLNTALQRIHTVISVILAKDGTQSTCQIALLDAAVKMGVKRFVPSEWACGSKGVEKVQMLSGKREVWEACERSGLGWARFNVGMFMNYLGIGCLREGEELEDALRGVDMEGDMLDGSGSFLLSIGSATAELPMRSDGKFPRVTFTEIGNIGEFVAASLELEKWDRDMDIAGCTIRLDELLRIAEGVAGRKLQVTKLMKQDLGEQIDSLDPGDFLKRMWLELKEMLCDEEVGEGVLDPIVNRMCPEVKALDVETYLKKHWVK